MPKKKYTDEIKSFIIANVNGKSNKEIVKLLEEHFSLSVTEKAVNSYLKNIGVIREVKASKLGINSIFSSEMVEYMEIICKGIGNQELTDRLNEKFGKDFKTKQVKAFKKNHKSLNSGLNGQFEKGIIPHNKGVKMSPDVYEKIKPTMFKKGNVPENHREVGSERVRSDGYIEIKVAEPRTWELKHRIVWQSVHGPIDPDDRVLFLDGDSLNTNIENLTLISNQELLELSRRKLIKKDASLTELGILVAKLSIATRNRRKGE